jgi:hypothetical protein
LRIKDYKLRIADYGLRIVVLWLAWRFFFLFELIANFAKIFAGFAVRNCGLENYALRIAE